MKCANCGAEWKEGNLYCDNCGYELQIVPDFEPEIENSISETLTTLVEDFSQEEQGSLPTPKNARKKPQKFRLWASAAGIGCVAVFGILLGWLNYTNSYEYQMQKAQNYAQKQNYEQAISCVSKAIGMEQGGEDAKLLLADYYLADGSTENARILLTEMIAQDNTSQESYRRLIGLYEKQEDYESISELLHGCNSQDIMEQYQKYVAMPPEFSYTEGSYTEVVALKLSSNTKGTIYYTLDGSTPTEKSDKYTAPFMLENGEYQVSALFVNEYGIHSECASKTYQISVAIPLAPEVNIYSGSYAQPTMIQVTVPDGCSVYYTMDGSTPTLDSILYAVPIAMPMGKSTFQFVTYSEDGIAGEITTRTFFLEVATQISAADAVNRLVLGLKDKGVLLEADGTLPSKAGIQIYIVSTIVDIGGIDFYLVAEYYEDAIGTRTRTGALYGVDANSGALYKITADDRGNYFASPL